MKHDILDRLKAGSRIGSLITVVLTIATSLFRKTTWQRAGEYANYLFPDLKDLDWKGRVSLVVVGLLIFSLLLSTAPQASNIAYGAYSTSTTDADGNTHLGNNTVQDTYFYDRTQDSSAATQQQLGVDPNWANGVSRRSHAVQFQQNQKQYGATGSNFPNITSAFTLEAWVNPTRTPPVHAGIITKFSSTQDKGYGLYLRASTRYVSLYTQPGSGGSETVTSEALPLNTWTHVVGIYDGTNGYVFYNGVLKATGALPNGPDANSAAVSIGRFYANVDANYFEGTIDEVRFSSGVRYPGATSVGTTYFTPPRRFAPDLTTAGLWHFDEGVGTTAYDASVYGNDITLTGTTNPPWVTGGNAIMDGYDGSKGWQTQSGAGNISLAERSSVSDDSAYELKTTGSNGLSFDGGDYGTMADSTTRDPGTGNYTIETWFKTTTGTTGTVLFFSDRGTSSTLVQFGLNASEKMYGVYRSATNQAITVDNSSGSALNDGMWHHAAWVRTSATTASMYLDGALLESASTGTFTGGIALAGNQPATIGKFADSANNFFTGTMDEMRFSTTDRYTANFSPSRRFATDSYTAALFHMDEGKDIVSCSNPSAGSATYTCDSSSNANTITLGSSSAANTSDPAWTEGVYSASSATSTSQNWALPGYSYRQRLNIATAAAIGAGYGVETSIDRATALDNRQTRADTRDWRVVYQPSDTYRSIDFDGTDDYIDMEDQSNLDRGDTADLTLEGWFNRDTATTDDVVVAKRNSLGTASDVGYIAYLDATTDQLIFEASDGTDEYSLTSASTFTSTGWHHFAIVWDQDSAANSEIYIDGRDDDATDSGTIGNIGDLSNAVDFRIGSESDGASYFDGKLDEIRVSSSVRYTGNFSPTRTPFVSDSSTLGLWHFDEGSGTVSVDASGYGYSGTLSGTPSWYATDGVVTTAQEVPRFIPHGHAVDFTPTDDYISVPDANSLDATNEVSVFAWIKPDTATSGNMRIVEKDFSTSWLLGTAGTNGLTVYINNAARATTANNVFTTNSWSYVGFAYSKSSGAVKIYVNGAVVASGSYSTAIGVDTSDLNIGGYTSSGYTFPGMIDDVRMYTRAVSATEVSGLYTGTAAPTNGLAGHWPFDDSTSGQTVADTSGNGNNGTFGVNSGIASDDPAWAANAGKTDSTAQTQFKIIAPVGASSNDKDYYIYYGNPNEGSNAQSTDPYGLSFDGTNDYISTTYAGVTGSGARSVAAWVYYDGGNSTSPIVSYGNNSNTGGAFGGYARFDLNVEGSSILLRVNGFNRTWTSAVTANQWSHIVFVYPSGANINSSNVKIYVNNVEITTGSVSGASPLATATGTTVRIGADSGATTGTTVGAPTNTFSGKIDDVRFYSTNLSATDVAALYAKGPVVTGGLAGRWRLNDATGATAADSSGNGYTGSLLNGYTNSPAANGTSAGPIWVETDEYPVGIATGSTQTSLVTEQESPVFFEYRSISGGSFGAWSADRSKTFQLTTGEQQLGSTGVYVSLNPAGVYSKEDHYVIASWALEGATTSGTEPGRGKDNAFPEKANLVATASGLDVIDATNNKLWMRFPAETSGIIGANAPESVTAKDGRIFIASNDGLSAIQFDMDDAHRWTSSGNSSWGGNLADRDDASAYAAAADQAINSSAVNDVSVAVIYNTDYSIYAQYIAVASDDGMSVIENSTLFGNTYTDPFRTLILDYGNGAITDNYNDVVITSGGELYGSNATDSELDRFNNVDADTVNQTSVDAPYTTSSTPALRNGTINDIAVTESTSLADNGSSNTVSVAHNTGIDVIQEHSTQASGTAKYYSREAAGSSNWSSKKFGGALYFDGGDRVRSAQMSGLSDYPITVEMWVKPEDATQRNIFALCTLNCTSPSLKIIRLADGSVRAYAQANYDSSAGVLPAGEWSHVAVSRGSGGTVNVYVNGTNVISQTNSGTTGSTSKEYAQIGLADSGSNWKGEIDEVRIVDAEVYTAAFTPSTTELTAITNTKLLWHFNEGTGQNVYDSSTSGYTGTIGADTSSGSDDPWWINPAIAGSADIATAVGMYNPTPSTGAALNFAGDGAASDDGDYVYVAESSSNTFSGTQPFTVMTWAYISDLSGTTEFFGMVDKYQAVNTDRSYGLMFDDTSNKFRFSTASACTGSVIGITNSAAITQATWYHVAVTKNGSTVTMYVNGSTSGTTQVQAHNSSISDCDSPLLLGITNSQSTEASSLKGKLDDVRIYNRALNASEISSIYTSKTTKNTISDLVAQYKMDVGVTKDITVSTDNVSGLRQVIQDATGSGEYGILKNGSSEPVAADGVTNGPTWTSGSPAVDGRILWVGTNGASANDGALTAISLDTDRQIRNFTSSNSGLPDNDLSTISMSRDNIALVGTADGGAWAPGTAGFIVDDTAATVATVQNPVRVKSGGTVRIKTGGTVRVAPK